MTKVPFKISARTAKLIGRENFSNPEGAIIELVKNCYDADAKECYVVFDIVCESVPESLSITQFQKFAKEHPIVKTSYKLKEKEYELNPNLVQEKVDELKSFFFSPNSIYIIDNGHGMTADAVKDQWMEIGTGNKEAKHISDDGRVKTGAKGIGRFALDRLGYTSEMWTVSKEKKQKASYWKMDWEQFDHANKGLLDIEADLEDIKLDFSQFIKQRFKGKTRLLNKISDKDFSHGTIIKVSGLKDNWLENNQESVFKSLEALVPPKELEIPFGVNFFSLQDLRIFGEVETAFFNDFDYKVEAIFNSKTLNLNLSITRDELDLKEVRKSYSHLFKQVKEPYDLKTLSDKKFSDSKTVFEVLKWERNTSNAALLQNLGDFAFTFYYLKNSVSKDYPYKSFNQGERQRVLKRFGGIKIYRDSFRVRPYGDIGNDWLKLGERSAQSPAGAGQKIGDWRVGPNQVAGLVKISRVKNPNLIDKSDRNALIENESFNILRRIIEGVVNVFEIDRSKILNPFYLEEQNKKKKEREIEIRVAAEKLADEIIEERSKVERIVYGHQPDLFKAQKEKQQKESYQRIIVEGLQKIEKRDEEDAEIAQVRTLASLGLIVSSFAHELKEVKNNIGDIVDLEKIFSKVVSPEGKKHREYKDGVNIIAALKNDSERIAHWVEYSLTAIKKDKRKRTSLKFEPFFHTLNRRWQKVFNDRNIKTSFSGKASKVYIFRAFEMDMNTIFNNLISNSIDSFNNLKKIRDRKISITTSLIRNHIELTYSDNGAGLPKVFQRNKEEIFLPFKTSKKDKDGNDIGTGLGMYLIKNVVDDNNGTIDIMDVQEGFKIKIRFPLRNK